MRARAADVMYEGALDAAVGTSRALDLSKLERIEYARLVRKGARTSQLAHGLLAGLSARTVLPNASSPCLGAFGGYQLDVSRFGARVQLGGCKGELQSATLRADVAAYELRGAVYHAWDFGGLSLEIGLGAGLSLFHQRFETRGSAPAQRALAPFSALHAGADLQLARGVYLSLQISGDTHFLRLRGRAAVDGLRVGFAARPSFAIGKQF